MQYYMCPQSMAYQKYLWQSTVSSNMAYNCFSSGNDVFGVGLIKSAIYQLLWRFYNLINIWHPKSIFKSCAALPQIQTLNRANFYENPYEPLHLDNLWPL